MPTLHISLRPASQGINKIALSNPLRSQNLTLQYAVVNKAGAGFAHNQIFVRLPFASASQIHSSVRRGYLAIPTQASTAGMETHSFGSGLPVEADHVPEVFEAQILDANGDAITSNTHFTSLDLYFAYESHSLF